MERDRTYIMEVLNDASMDIHNKANALEAFVLTCRQESVVETHSEIAKHADIPELSVIASSVVSETTAIFGGFAL